MVDSEVVYVHKIPMDASTDVNVGNIPCSPEGKDELKQIRQTVLDTLNGEQDGQYDEVLHPLFV